MAIIIGLAIGLTAGTVAAVKKDTAWDYAAGVLALWGRSTPSFWLGIMLIFLFAVKLDWLPASGYVRPSEDLWQSLAATRLADGGILGLYGGDGALTGLLSWREEQRLAHGKVLAVQDFVVFELSRAAPGRRALCDAAEKLARARNCDAIEFRVPAKLSGECLPARLAGWLELGHGIDSLVLLKPLRPTAPRLAAAR